MMAVTDEKMDDSLRQSNEKSALHNKPLKGLFLHNKYSFCKTSQYNII